MTKEKFIEMVVSLSDHFLLLSLYDKKYYKQLMPIADPDYVTLIDIQRINSNQMARATSWVVE